MALLPVAIDRQTPVLVCTTGFNETQQAALLDAGRSVPVMVGANMSISVIAMYQLVKSAARMLGEEFDIEIFDFHPWDKIDFSIRNGTGTCRIRSRRAWRSSVRRDGDCAAWRNGKTYARQDRFFIGAWRRGNVRKLGLFRWSRPTSRDHQSGNGLQGVRRSHPGCCGMGSGPAPGFYGMDDMLRGTD